MTETQLDQSPHSRYASRNREVACPKQLTTGPDLFDVIVDRAIIYGDRPFIRHARRTRLMSFAALARSVTWWGRWLESQNLARDDRIAIAIADPLDFATVFLAIIANGRWATPLDPNAPARSTLDAIERLRPAIVVSDRGAVPAATVRWLTLDAIYGGPPGADPGARDGGLLGVHAGGGVVLASSGSTGQPKIISLRQDQLLHSARAIADHHRLTTADVGFNPLPLFHVNAEVVGLLASLWAGAELVVDERFHRTGFWDLVGEQRVTWINAVPAMIRRLAPLGPSEVIPKTVRFIRSASAPLPVATLKRFEESTGIVVLETYGMTESASQITANPLEGPRKPGSVGLPVGVELRVVIDPIFGRVVTSDSGGSDPGERGGPKEAMVGESGHVEIRGPSVGALATTMSQGRDGNAGRPGGWLRTGDVGCLDEDGYLYLQGREDDVINRGGEKVYPREIEEILLEDPRVIDAVVIGLDDESLGQVPVAYLTIREVLDRSDTQQALSVGQDAMGRLSEMLPKGKWPASLHVVPGLPTTATGKLLRHPRGSVGSDTIVTLPGR
jgi:acyl-CoA synthetase (AMP-forming)/AMP-acid ligase II